MSIFSWVSLKTYSSSCSKCFDLPLLILFCICLFVKTAAGTELNTSIIKNSCPVVQHFIYTLVFVRHAVRHLGITVNKQDRVISLWHL